MPSEATHDHGTSELANTREQIERVEERILAATERFGYPKSARFAIKLALEEAITNAFQHGHRDLPDDTTITVEYAVGPEQLTVTVEDKGPGFDPGDIPDPTLEENLAAPSGRGLMLIRAYMTDVSHNNRGNRLTMRFRKPDPSADA